MADFALKAVGLSVFWYKKRRHPSLAKSLQGQHGRRKARNSEGAGSQPSMHSFLVVRSRAHVATVDYYKPTSGELPLEPIGAGSDATPPASSKGTTNTMRQAPTPFTLVGNAGAVAGGLFFGNRR